MLQSLHHTNCLTCGKPYGATDFGYYSGRPENGPAYWSERGLLCSHECAGQPHRQRFAAGDPMRDPADNPLERTNARR